MFLSYAQNCEDLILERAFGDQQGGFYIDVGACHPVAHSVTKHFYEKGWAGINIEPQLSMIELLNADRARDINLNLGISDAEGELTFYEAPDSVGLSTFTSDWRDGWAMREGHKFIERKARVTTLSAVCEQYVRHRIDFLKIDAEGHEGQVLAGCDFKQWRPRVILTEGDPGDWELNLLASGYHFATTDGVNRYYVRDEDRDLIAALDSAANDDPVVIPHHIEPVRHLLAVWHDEKARHRLAVEELARDREALALARAELAEVRAREAAVREILVEAAGPSLRVDSGHDLGPSAVAVARRLQGMARRHPRSSAMVRKVLLGK